MNEKQAREIVYERSEGWCEVAVNGFCLGRAGNWHHRGTVGRIWTPANGLHLCGSGTTGCHGWITEHPKISLAMGWSVSSFTDLDAVHLVPVVVRPGRRLLHPHEPRYLRLPARRVRPQVTTPRPDSGTDADPAKGSVSG